MVVNVALNLVILHGGAIRDPGFGCATGGYVVRVPLAMPFSHLLMSLQS
jgi:hypothetical protein